jgi:glycogen synthase
MKTKVLMFGWEFPPHNSGGLGTACQGLTEGFAGQDVELIFVLPKRIEAHSNSASIVFADIQDFTVERVDTLVYPYVTEEQYFRERREEPSNAYGRNLFEEVLLYGERAQVLARKYQFDVIHAHDWLSFKAGLLAKKVSGKPLVVHVHATEFDRCGGRGINPKVYEIEKEGMEGADKIIAVSNLTKNIVVREYGIAPEKVEVIHNCINSSEFTPLPKVLQEIKDAGNSIVLYVGRITIQKGPDYFVKAAKRVLDVRPNVYFIVAGSGDMYEAMIRLSADLGIADKVIFSGFTRGDDLNALYQSADLFVLPSVSEPFGLTPLESVVNGTPVLISKQSGVSEVLQNALKVDFWDIDEMANKIISVIDHAQLKNTLKENGFLEVSRFSWKTAAEACIRLYKNIIPNR